MSEPHISNRRSYHQIADALARALLSRRKNASTQNEVLRSENLQRLFRPIARMQTKRKASYNHLFAQESSVGSGIGRNVLCKWMPASSSFSIILFALCVMES